MSPLTPNEAALLREVEELVEAGVLIARDASRNGRVVWTSCPGCGRKLSLFEPVDSGDRATGPPKLLIAHCSACHDDGHRACEMCGRCLPSSGPGGSVRIDKRYHDGACRQRAYRGRVRERREDCLDHEREGGE